MRAFVVVLAAALCQPGLVILGYEYADLEVRKWPEGGWVGWGAGRKASAVKFRVVERIPDCADGQDVRLTAVPVAMPFAVRCVPGVEPGSIISVAMERGDLEPGRPLNLALGNSKYQVVARADGDVILSSGRRKQVIYSAGEFADDPHYSIVWAGDLDRDGKLDLLVNLSRKYSVHPFRLLLSSKALRGRLVGDAASVTITAC